MVSCAALWLILVFAPTSAPAGTGPEPDYSTPRNALKTLMDAMYRADEKGVRAAAIIDESLDASIPAIVTYLAADAKLHEAVAEKFGADYARLNQRRQKFNERVDEMKESVDGDSATIKDTAKGTLYTFKKSDGSWKVEFSSVPRRALDQEQLAAATKLLNETADEVRRGAFPNLEETAEEINFKMRALLQKSTSKPAISPSTTAS